MSHRLIALSFVGLFAILGAQEALERAYAQVVAPQPTAAPTRPSALPAQASMEIRSYGLAGTSILGSDGKEVGYFRELLFTSNGQISAITFDVGGFLGVGAKTVALPYSTVRFDTMAGKITAIHVPFVQADFKNTPKFRYLQPPEKKAADKK